MKERFEQIYATNEWGPGSGVGSLPRHTRGYVELLQQFLADHRVESVVDLGCGDWQFSRLIDWSGIGYRGLDLVSDVIERNQRLYGAANIQFDIVPADFAQLPTADLLIVKDVMQHWSNRSVERFLPHLNSYRYSLVTNCTNPTAETLNCDIEDGDFRYLDIRRPPFRVACDEIYAFTNHRPRWIRFARRIKWLKRVLLVTGQTG